MNNFQSYGNKCKYLANSLISFSSFLKIIVDFTSYDVLRGVKEYTFFSDLITLSCREYPYSNVTWILARLWNANPDHK